jgi:hypothetical protein
MIQSTSLTVKGHNHTSTAGICLNLGAMMIFQNLVKDQLVTFQKACLLTKKEKQKQKQKQKQKSETFIEEAMMSLDNHYLPWCNELLSAASGGEAPLAKVFARILLSHHLPDNPNKQNQIDAEFFSHDHNQHVNLLEFASFVRKNNTHKRMKWRKQQ